VDFNAKAMASKLEPLPEAKTASLATARLSADGDRGRSFDDDHQFFLLALRSLTLNGYSPVKQA
jgi:hypothetical protein